jgi:magnesium-transporting ATPase (P-type)
MRRFRLVQPDDAEVMRDSNWVRYDSGSLVIGDLVRLVEGDVVPADCVVMSLGMGDVDDAHVVNDDDDDEDDDDGAETGGGTHDGCDDAEIAVDARLVTGEIVPTRIRRRRNGTVGGGVTTLYYGSRVLRGSCVAVVIATGERVILSKLIRARRWPTSLDLSEEVLEMTRMENEGVIL